MLSLQSLSSALAEDRITVEDFVLYKDKLVIRMFKGDYIEICYDYKDLLWAKSPLDFVIASIRRTVKDE